MDILVSAYWTCTCVAFRAIELKVNWVI